MKKLHHTLLIQNMHLFTQIDIIATYTEHGNVQDTHEQLLSYAFYLGLFLFLIYCLM